MTPVMEFSECNFFHMVQEFKHIEVTTEKDIGKIFLSRPETNNALNSLMIEEIIKAMKLLNENDQVRFIHLQGKGKMFSSGADLNWMKNATGEAYMLNYDDSLKMAKCFYSVFSSKKITISSVHGAVYGGGNGLIASTDFSLAQKDTIFIFSEVKLGLVPATIAPYVIKKIGVNRTKELMLTGRKFSAGEALTYGLLYKLADTDDSLDNRFNELIDELREGAPETQKAIKRLIQDISERIVDENLMQYTAGILAKTRVSSEGVEGINSFFEKRKPSWTFHQ
jgi:methylglutaconyl-CoA hydratase